jgi:hypothetical protein
VRFVRRTTSAGRAEAEHVVQHRARLRLGEAQVARAHLPQRRPRAQAGERQRRIDARGEHEVQRRRQAVDQVRDLVVHRRARDQVVVVEHEHHVAGERREVVQEQRQDVVRDARAGRSEQGGRARADAGRHGLEGRDEVRPEADGIAIGALDRKPRERPLLLVGRAPVGEQRGLAPACRCADQRHPARLRREARREPVPSHVRPLRRRHELRRDEHGDARHRHGAAALGRLRDCRAFHLRRRAPRAASMSLTGDAACARPLPQCAAPHLRLHHR